MKKILVLNVAISSVVAVAGLLHGCSGGTGPDTGLQQNTAPPVSDRYSLPVPEELARLEELPTPEGADPAIFAALKSELAGMLRERGDNRIVSAPPMLPASSAYLSWDNDISTLNWGYKCTGDYNQDSLVGVNDITALGQNYLAEVPGDPDSMLAVVDGNGDGLITVNDITQIGQNYGVRVTGYNVYASSELSDYPSEAASGNGDATQLGSMPFPEGPPPAGERRRFEFAVADPQPETYFWVRPTDGTSEGTPSSYYYLPTPANQPPVASLTANPLLGDIPMLVQFDASASSDPDGEIVKYEWDWDGLANGWVWEDTETTPTASHTYTEIDTFTVLVRVTDNQGEIDTTSIEIHATAPGNDPPVAVLTADPTSGEPPLMVSFDASGSFDPDGEIVKYEWDWDGTGSGPWEKGSPTTSREYAAGSYTAWVQVTDELGETARDSVSISTTGPYGMWPTFRFDNLHTGRSPYVGAQTNNVKWSYTTGNILGRSSPAIGTDGTVYVGSNDDNLYAINPNGSLKWSYTTGGDVWSSPAVSVDGTVYVGSWDGKLHALNPDGSMKWAFPTEDRVDRSSPTIGADGTVYVGSNDDKLYAVNPDGSLKWSYTTGGDVWSSPAIGTDGTLYVGSNDHKLYALNPDGSLKWSYTMGDFVRSSPAIGADGTLYVGSKDGRLYAISPEGGLKWSYVSGDLMISSPAIGTDGTVYIGSNDYKLYAVNPDGSLKWSYPTGGYVRSSPAIGADGTVYVGSRDSKLYAINPDGSLKWSYTTGGDVRSSPAIGADGTVYVGCDDHKLYAFGP